MKRFVLIIIALIYPFLLASCQEKLEWTIDIQSGNIIPPEDEVILQKPGYEELMPLTVEHRNPHPQGGDSWGNYFFQFAINNSVVRVFDLATKSLVQTVSLGKSQKGFVSDCHCNTVCFGTEYYDAEDIFPLIYVSTGYAAGGYTGALVYRIVQHNGIFFITHVQTIKFPVDKSSWTEFVPGEEGFAYLCYTSEKIIFKVKMPKLKDGDVIISREDALETYQFSPLPNWMSTSRGQDRLFFNGKILYITGVPETGEASAFVVLNLETQEREAIIDFKKIGLTRESESLFLWQGDIYVAFVDKIVKLINFIDTP